MSKVKSASGGVVRIYPNLAADSFNNQLADRKSESGALRPFVQLLETIENRALLFQWDSATGIGDGETMRNLLIPAELRELDFPGGVNLVAVNQ